jgi:predicted ATPase
VEAVVGDALTLTLPPVGARRQLLDYLSSRRMLLIFDNFEHITAAASFVAELLEAAPHVVVMVTSRTRLRLRGERVLHLRGLQTAPADEDEAMTTEAAQLFVAAAQRLVPALSLSDEEASDVAAICRLVEGVPLAIELAAQWVDSLPLAEIASELTGGIRPLQAEIVDLPSRQRSMEVVFSASWQRLTPAAQAVLARLSVFRGGFTLQAAADVAGASPKTLAHLVAHSLLRFVPAERRYHCHELLRHYAATRLQEDRAQVAETRRRHLAYFRELATQGGQALKGGDGLAWMRRLKLEQGNFEEALAWGLVNDVEEAAQIAIGLHLFYFIAGKMVYGQQLYHSLLSRKASLSESTYGWVLTWYTSMIWVLGKLEDTRRLAEEAELLFRELGDPAGVMMSHHHRSVAAFYRGDLESAVFHSDQGVALGRTTAEKSPWFLIACLQARSTFLAEMGEEEGAYQASLECLRLSQAAGSGWTASYAMANLARFAIKRGDLAEAAELSEQALGIARDLNDRRMEGIQQLVRGNIDLAQRDFATAVENLELAVAIADEIGSADVLDEALMLLGDAYRGTGQLDLALPTFIRWAQLSQKLKNPANMATSLGRIANVCWRRQPDSLQSVRWLAAVTAWRADNPSEEQAVEEKWRAAMCAQLPAADFSAAWKTGMALTVDQALAEAFATS